MSINFIPNDPGAGATAPPIRIQPKRPDRPSAKAGFTFSGVSPEGTFAPGTSQFLFWQCREAALAAVQAWEASASAHKKWQGNRKKLPLLQTRQKLLAVTATLRKRSFVETTAENLSEGIRRLIPTHNAAEPRHAFNTLKFQLPQTLPDDGGPGVLINEVHSFGMIFTGCFWDLIANLFGAAASQTEATLLSAARTAGRILIEGTKSAIVTPRFLQSVGRAMVLTDETRNGGANRDRIRDAFQRHDILLGANAMLAPSMALAGTAPKKSTSLGSATRKDLLKRLGIVKGAKLSLSKANLFGKPVVSVVHKQEVPLGTLDNRLKGVVAEAHAPIMVGASGAKAAVIGTPPHPADAESEVQAFVKTLLKHGRIDFGKQKRGAVAGNRERVHTTHEIKSVAGKKVLRRVRFLCARCSWSV